MGNSRFRKMSHKQQKQRKDEERTSLSNLREMMNKSKVFNPPPSVIQDDDDDDVYVEVWNVLSDGRERTAEEIRVKLNDGADLAEIENILKILENEGKVTGRALSVSGFSVSCKRSYVMKTGIDFSAVKSQINPKRKTLGVETMARQKQIAVERTDSLDTAIWKSMCDRRSRKLEEIADILQEYGFVRAKVKDRVIDLGYKGWFTRSGNGWNTTFTLQKTIRMPEDKKQEKQEEVKEQKQNSTTTFFERKEVKPEQSSYSLDPVLNKELDPGKIPFEQVSVEQNPVVQEPEVKTIPVNKQQYVVSSSDTAEVAIWKVMHDGGSFLPSEVALLLEDYDFTPKTIKTRFSVIHSERGWFDRVPEGQTFRYTLKPGIPFPGAEVKNPNQGVLPEIKRDEPSAEQKEIQPAPITKNNITEATEDNIRATNPLEKTVVTSTKTEPRVKATLDLVTTNGAGSDTGSGLKLSTVGEVGSTPAVVQPVLVESNLLKFKAEIKGMTFTFDQLRLLTNDLTGAGYGEGRFKNMKSSLLVRHHQIREQKFTDLELEELTETLKANGFHNQ